MNNALVTVVMPAYNAARHLREAVDSVLAQEFQDFELLVVDDGSTDDTAAILQSYGGRIRVLSQANSGTPAAARNSGIGASRSKYVAFFDSDDIMAPNHLANAVAILEHCSDVALAFSNFVTFGDGVIDTRSWFEREHVARVMAGVPTTSIGDHRWVCDRPILGELLRSNYVHTSSVVMKRTTLVEHRMFDATWFGCEDWDLWLRLSQAGERFGYCSLVTSRYRILQSSVSRSAAHYLSTAHLLEQMLRDSDPALRSVLQGRLKDTYRAHASASRKGGNYGSAMRSDWKSMKVGGLITNRSDVGWFTSRSIRTAARWVLSRF